MKESTLPTRVPLPGRALLDRLKIPSPQAAFPGLLQDVSVDLEIIQDFRPLSGSLEWDLANLYWVTHGVLPFVDNEVPYLINNSGRASEDAATVLYSNCLDEMPAGPIRVLELGAGIGLFARYFLDAFRRICAQEGQNFYDRLVYLVSDRSPRTVQHWRERDIFAEHEGHVVAGCCEAMRPAEFRSETGERVDLEPLRAVIANYVLDVLPAAIVRTGTAGAEQLCVRTHLTNHRLLLPQYSSLSVEQVRALAASQDPIERARVIPALSLMEFETSFRPVADDAPPCLEEALAFGKDLARVVLNYGAFQCLEECLRQLSPPGFVLINEYGPIQRDQIADHATTQRFGFSTAVGMNFPLLEHHFAERGYVVLKPEGDENQPIHTRLLSCCLLPQARASFENRYRSAAREYFELPTAEGRRHAAAGRYNDALENYRTALSRNSRDWCLIGECAEFVGLQLRDFQAGLELARAALELNPSYSAWLWNVLGDCLFCLERYNEAHEAYLQAQRIQHDDVRTNFNLSYTFLQRGVYAEALAAIARALAADFQGRYRERLLDKQSQIMTALSGRWVGEQERLLKRATAFA